MEKSRLFYEEKEFKDTEIGKIPKDWDIVKLEDVAKFKRGFSYRSQDLNKKPTSVRFITINDIEKEGGIKLNVEPLYLSEHIKIDSNFFLESGDLLIANTDMSKGFIIGAPILIEKIETNAVYSMDLTKLIFNNSELESKYLFYYFKYEPTRQRMKSFAQGTNVLHLNHELIKSLPTPIPPLSEQRQIASILSAIDQAIEKTDEVIAKTERLKKGLMQELLTKGIGHKEFKDTEIGKIPKDWKTSTLDQLVEVYDNRRIPMNEMERNKRKGVYPYCGANGIIDFVDDYLFEGEYILLAEDGGDYDSFGRSAYIMTGRFWVNNHAHVLRAIPDRTSNTFLLYSLNYLDLNPYIVGSTRKKLNQDAMKRIIIPLPPLEEQQQIASILSAIDRKLELERNEKSRLERIKKGFMNKLLTGEIRVRVEN